MVVQPYANLS